jgi:hypothetical protein
MWAQKWHIFQEWATREFEFFPLLIEGTLLGLFFENPMVMLFAIASGVVVLNSWRFNCVEVENWKTWCQNQKIHIMTLTYWAWTWKFKVAFSWKGQCFVCWILEGDELHTRFSFLCNDHISLAHHVEKFKLKQFPRIQLGEGYAI